MAIGCWGKFCLYAVSGAGAGDGVQDRLSILIIGGSLNISVFGRIVLSVASCGQCAP